MRSDSLGQLLLQIVLALNAVRVDGPLILDAKALAIAWHSADPDAGRGAGQLAKGYKLHMIVDRGGNLRAFEVCALNVSEQTVARSLIAQLDRQRRCMLADANYDSNRLDDLAGAKGIQLLAARRYKNAKGIGHHRHSPHRLAAIKEMQEDPRRLAERRRIEGCFGTLGNVIGGLNGLPNWVRRQHRVKRWVLTKLIIDATHRKRREAMLAA